MGDKGKIEKLEKCHWFKYCKNAIYTGKCKSCGKSKLNFVQKDKDIENKKER